MATLYGEYSVNDSYITLVFAYDDISGTTSYMIDGDTLTIDGGTYQRVDDGYLDGKSIENYEDTEDYEIEDWLEFLMDFHA